MAYGSGMPRRMHEPPPGRTPRPGVNYDPRGGAPHLSPESPLGRVKTYAETATNPIQTLGRAAEYWSDPGSGGRQALTAGWRGLSGIAKWLTQERNEQAREEARSRGPRSPGSASEAPGRRPAPPAEAPQPTPQAPTTAGGTQKGLTSQTEPGSGVPHYLRRPGGPAPPEPGRPVAPPRAALRYGDATTGGLQDYDPDAPGPDVGAPGRGGFVAGGGFEHMSPGQRAAFPSYQSGLQTRGLEAETALREREAEDPGFLGHQAGIAREAQAEDRAAQAEMQAQLQQQANTLIQQFEDERGRLQQILADPGLSEEEKRQVQQELGNLESGLQMRLRSLGFDVPEMM